MYVLVHPKDCPASNVFGLLKNGNNTSLVVIVPGFGMFSSSWQLAIDHELSSKNYSILHIHLSSSYYGSGLHSISDSAEELLRVVYSLKFDKLVLIGHSTGAQISVEFVKNFGNKFNGLQLILLAPVSDRLALANSPLVATAREWVARGKGSHILPDLLWNCPVTAKRLLELSTVGGADDYFSPDLNDKSLGEKYENVTFGRILFVYGSNDEYIDNLSEYEKLGQRIIDITKGLGKISIVRGDHYFSNNNHGLCQEIAKFLIE